MLLMGLDVVVMRMMKSGCKPFRACCAACDVYVGVRQHMLRGKRPLKSSKVRYMMGQSFEEARRCCSCYRQLGCCVDVDGSMTLQSSKKCLHHLLLRSLGSACVDVVEDSYV